MDQTTLKIAIAAFIHDIGKFADKKALNVTEKYLNDNEGLYLPSFKGQYSHSHAVCTAAFIEYLKELLPDQFNQSKWGEGDALINLAAGHHDPQTPMQWVIAKADRVSSGFDRDTFDNAKKIPIKDYKKTRLLPLFEQLKMNENGGFNSSDEFSYAYPLKSISPESIFPQLIKDIKPAQKESADGEYLALYEDFVDKLRNLKHKNENIELWFEHFESLFMLYTSAIPAARVGDVVHDVSLYDHSRLTSAFATAIYLYHKEHGLTAEAIQNDKDKKFLLIHSDFYGIQNFIFGGYGSSRKYRSKLLRGRSFTVSLLTELASDMLCREIGLPFTSVILNAAGKFTILAPNIKRTLDAIDKVKRKINDWLIKISYGETTIGISHKVTASCDDFVKSFPKLWRQIGQEADEIKFNKIDLDRHGGAVKEYLNSFDNSLEHPLCPLCGKRPSDLKVEGNDYITEAKSSCSLCRDHIFLGTKLVKENKIAVILKDTVNKQSENQLYKPLFGEYQVLFPENDLDNLAAEGKLIKYWNLGVDRQGNIASDASVKFINGYIPKYQEEDFQDKRLKFEEEEKINEPMTFNHIACKAQNPTQDKDKFCGLEALGVLKADVDNLGILMACGLKPERLTLSRLSALSRQLNYYFSVFLPDYLRKTPKYNDVYTVFAGGDDLFLIGPWNHIIDLVADLRKSFADYVCNPDIHFSAGITIHKSHTPINVMAENAEEALEISKGADENKNRLTVFSQTVKRDESKELAIVETTLNYWFEQKWINNAMLYRLNEFIRMSEEEKRLTGKKTIPLDKMSCTKWRFMLAYSTERNVAKNEKGEIRKERIRLIYKELALWLEKYRGNLKIPVWRILYDRR